MMQQKEIRDMLRHMEEYPQSEFSKFVFNTENKAMDLIDFMMWLESNTIIVAADGGWERYMINAYNYLFNPENYDTLIIKYLNAIQNG